MATEQKSPRALNIILWLAQGFLALTFIWAGYMKLFQPDGLPFPWVKDNPGLAPITGIVDLLAGLGILFPALLRIQPKLTVYAAYGTVALMVAASFFHISRGEAKDIGFNVFIALLAVFVAWGRLSKAPIVARNL